MGRTTETNERGPWTVERAIELLDRVHPLDAKEIHRALRTKAKALAHALREALSTCGENAKVSAGALLLMLNDKSGRRPFLAALSGPDGEARTLAIEFIHYCVFPQDIEYRGTEVTQCPVSSDELFDAIERDLHEPWTGLSLRVLEIVSWQDYRQARAITRPLLTHGDPAIRKKVAQSYLRAGRDEGAFAVAEHILRSAPPYIPHRDPRWHDFYHVKGLWWFVELAAQSGNAELRNKAAALAMEFVSEALDASDCAQRFDTNDGLVDAFNTAKILAAVMPPGSKELLERLIFCAVIDEYYRGEALVSYAQALGDRARPVVLSALQDEALRKYAARAMRQLAKAKHDPQDVAALSDVLSREQRPDVVAVTAKALLDAGPEGRSPVEAALERAEPWTRVELAWRINGGTDRQFADLLTEAGVMDPITDEQMTEVLRKGFDVRSLIWAGGNRLVMFNVKASTGLEHFDLFQDMLKAARPVIAVENLKETINASLLRDPVPNMPNIEKVTDLETKCTISFSHDGQAFSFNASPQGRWHDVPAVMKGFDDFMRAIGRDDRCYELEGGGEWALFVVAPAAKFEPIATRLRIPLERDSESARNAAKAYQQQIQSM